jgi:hypothetical protein
MMHQISNEELGKINQHALDCAEAKELLIRLVEEFRLTDSDYHLPYCVYCDMSTWSENDVLVHDASCAWLAAKRYVEAGSA